MKHLNQRKNTSPLTNLNFYYFQPYLYFKKIISQQKWVHGNLGMGGGREGEEGGGGGEEEGGGCKGEKPLFANQHSLTARYGPENKGTGKKAQQFHSKAPEN